MLKLTSALAFVVGSVLGTNAPCSYTFDGAKSASDKLWSYDTAFLALKTQVESSQDPAGQIQSFARRESKMREVVSMLNELQPFLDNATETFSVGRRLSSSGNADPAALFAQGYDIYTQCTSTRPLLNDMHRRSGILGGFSLIALLEEAHTVWVKDVLSGLPAEHGFSGKSSGDFASSNPCSVGPTSISLLTAKLVSNKPEIELLEALADNDTAINMTIGQTEFNARVIKMQFLDSQGGPLESTIKIMQRMVDIRGMRGRRLSTASLEVARKMRALEGMTPHVSDIERRYIIMKCEVEPKLERIVAGVEEVLSNASACGSPGDVWVCGPTFSETPSWCGQAADVCAGTLFYPPTWCPPAPPRAPPAPPAPPPPPDEADVDADEEFAVSFTLTALGDVSDYTPTVKDAMATKVATTAGVDKSKVSILVTAGSVNIEITITAATATAATTAGAAVQSSVSTAAAATTFFSSVPGITINVASVTAISAPFSTRTASAGLDSGVIAGIAIGAVVGAIVIGAVVYFTIFKKKAKLSKTLAASV